MSPKPYSSSSFTGYEHYANDTIPFFRGGPPPLRRTPIYTTNTVPKKPLGSGPEATKSNAVSKKKAATKSTRKETGQPIRRKPKSPTISFPWSPRHSPAKVSQQSIGTSARSPVPKVSSHDKEAGEHRSPSTFSKHVSDSPFGPSFNAPATLETTFTIKENVRPSPTSKTLTSPKCVRRASAAVMGGSASNLSIPRVIPKHRSLSLAEGMKLPHRVKWGSPEFPFIKPQRLQKAKTMVYAAPMKNGQSTAIRGSADQFRRTRTSSSLSSPTRQKLGHGQNDGSVGSGESRRKQQDPLQSVNISLLHTSLPVREPVHVAPSHTGVAPSGTVLPLQRKFVSLKPLRDPPTPTSPSGSSPKKSKGTTDNDAKVIQPVKGPGKAILPTTVSNVLSLSSMSVFATEIDSHREK